MNILVVGSGCCEHAIAWKLQQSSNVECVYVAPGNAGTALDSVNTPISECDVNAISPFAKNKNIGLVVIIQVSLDIFQKNSYNNEVV